MHVVCFDDTFPGRGVFHLQSVRCQHFTRTFLLMFDRMRCNFAQSCFVIHDHAADPRCSKKSLQVRALVAGPFGSLHSCAPTWPQCHSCKATVPQPLDCSATDPWPQCHSYLEPANEITPMCVGMPPHHMSSWHWPIARLAGLLLCERLRPTVSCLAFPQRGTVFAFVNCLVSLNYFSARRPTHKLRAALQSLSDSHPRQRSQ